MCEEQARERMQRRWVSSKKYYRIKHWANGDTFWTK